MDISVEYYLMFALTFLLKIKLHCLNSCCTGIPARCTVLIPAALTIKTVAPALFFAAQALISLAQAFRHVALTFQTAAQAFKTVALTFQTAALTLLFAAQAFITAAGSICTAADSFPHCRTAFTPACTAFKTRCTAYNTRCTASTSSCTAFIHGLKNVPAPLHCLYSALRGRSYNSKCLYTAGTGFHKHCTAFIRLAPPLIPVALPYYALHCLYYGLYHRYIPVKP
ncbi:MAG: hypothetical protein GY940_08565 [bacterium]|nr:hypothetical protein [bacterium]